MSNTAFQVYSPDGFPIADTQYKSQLEANEAFIEWQKQFNLQGYYSTIRDGERLRIPVSDLKSYCKIVEEEKWELF